MRARTSLNFGLIGPPTAESVALERLEKKHMFMMGNRMYSLLSAVLDQILFILAGNDYIKRAWMSLKFSQIQPLVAWRYSSVGSDVAWESRCTAIDPRIRHIFS